MMESPAPGPGGVMTADIDVGLDYLQALRHHFVGRVQKSTPTGRQQSAVLVILPDALLLCSNRGGVHTYIPLPDLVAMTLYPRGRFAVHVKGRHDLLLTTSRAQRVAGILSRLVAGLRGAPLPVHQDEKPPQLELLGLRPDATFHALVPQSLVNALRDARLSIAKTAAAAVRSALVDPLAAVANEPQQQASQSPFEQASKRTPAAATMFTAGGDVPFQARGVRTDDHANVAAQRAATTTTLSASPPRGKQQHVDIAGSATATTAPPSSASTTNTAAIEFAAKLRAARREKEEASRALTILVIQRRSSVITVPVFQSVWSYLCSAVDMLPGATQEPTVLVHCVEDSSAKKAINATLVHQTMVLFAEERPHMLTLYTKATGEGHSFDSAVFWSTTAPQEFDR